MSRADLISLDTQAKLQARIAELTEACMSSEFVGTPDQISQQLGQFQFLRGKVDAYQELLADHRAAIESSQEN